MGRNKYRTKTVKKIVMKRWTEGGEEREEESDGVVGDSVLQVSPSSGSGALSLTGVTLKQ